MECIRLAFAPINFYCVSHADQRDLWTCGLFAISENSWFWLHFACHLYSHRFPAFPFSTFVALLFSNLLLAHGSLYLWSSVLSRMTQIERQCFCFASWYLLLAKLSQTFVFVFLFDVLPSPFSVLHHALQFADHFCKPFKLSYLLLGGVWLCCLVRICVLAFFISKYLALLFIDVFVLESAILVRASMIYLTAVCMHEGVTAQEEKGWWWCLMCVLSGRVS